jgi:hypothetical protein
MLDDFQNAFVRLVADARVRRTFYRDPHRVLDQFRLGTAERAALFALPHAALERYAQSLAAKRWGQVARVVPLTLRVSPRLGSHYRAWALEHPATATESHLPPGVEEGLRAHDHLRQVLSDEREASYAPDLCSFEILRAATRGDGAARTFVSGFDVVEIAREVERGLLPIEPERRDLEVLLERARVRWRPRCS